MREDNIRDAITKMSPDKFERFSRELIRRELYPGLNPTSESHDLGEDSRTEQSTTLLHDGRWISLAISKTTSLEKIRSDCRTIQKNNRSVDVIVYSTITDLRTDGEEEWRAIIQSEFGWNLEMRTLRWLAPVASKPEYESFVDDYLNIPPPGGDYIQTIEQEFNIHTQRVLSQIRNKIPGLSTTLQRTEISTVEDQLESHRPVLLTGSAGTGKSAIGAQLAQNGSNDGKSVLFLDVRSISHLDTEGEIRSHLGLNGRVDTAILRIGRHKGCRVIIDQLDNIVGTNAANMVVDLILDCIRDPIHIDMIIISRNDEESEGKLLLRLLMNDFVELRCPPISELTVQDVFRQIGIDSYSAETIELGRNLLNLELIGTIQQQLPSSDFSSLTDEVYLWEFYMGVLRRGEQVPTGDQILAEAVLLSQRALSNPDGKFELEFPLSFFHQRLVSWGIMTHLEGWIYRFRHERFQEYLYAWGATNRHLMPKQVILEITRYRSQTIFRWMVAIYKRNNQNAYTQFLKETFDVG